MSTVPPPFLPAVGAKGSSLPLWHIMLAATREGGPTWQHQWVPLHDAAELNRLAAFRLMAMAAPSLLLAPDIWQRLPLHFAAMNGFTEIAQVAATLRPDSVGSVDQDGDNAFLGAAYYGHDKVVEALFAIHPDGLLASNLNDQNALHIAVRRGHTDVVRLLLRICPELKRKRDHEGKTPSQIAGDHMKLFFKTM